MPTSARRIEESAPDRPPPPRRSPRVSAKNPMSMIIGSALQRTMWDLFRREGTGHSMNAATLWYILDRCEAEGIAYRLTAEPNAGYFIEPLVKRPKHTNEGKTLAKKNREELSDEE